jgi:epoxyqueuosine reductase QueG
MNPDVWVGDMTRRISGRGFNLVGVADAAAFDAAAPAGHRLRDLLPGARSAVMIAVGGRGLWGHATASGKSMCLALQNATPDPDPIDRFTRDVVSAEAARFGTAFPSARLHVAYPFGDEAADVSFARLAEEAGLGSADTVLRLLLHPEYGPWVSLRACLLTDLELRRDGRLRDFRPCEGCRRPCLDVCPAGVVTPGAPAWTSAPRASSRPPDGITTPASPTDWRVRIASTDASRGWPARSARSIASGPPR